MLSMRPAKISTRRARTTTDPQSSRRPTDGWAAPTLVWDGPFEWALSITQETWLWAGEAGVVKAQEPKIIEALETIDAQGGFLEPVNPHWLAIYDK